MNLLIVTHQYPQYGKNNTPVVHDFAKSFIKLDHKVQVFNVRKNYPFIDLLPRWLVKAIESKFDKRIENFTQGEEVFDAIPVLRIPLKPSFLSSTKSQVLCVSEKIMKYVKKSKFNPDYILIHWEIPYYKIGIELSKRLNIPKSIVIHSLEKLNQKDLLNILSYDKVGFRSSSLKDLFCEKASVSSNSPKFFLCPSGINTENIIRTYKNKRIDRIKNYIYVGSMIERKFPHIILPAIQKAQINFEKIEFFGDGYMLKKIKNQKNLFRLDSQKKILIAGKASKNIVLNKMVESDCLIMISKNEAFGLVYLEAMLRGCLVIAGKKEGMDGIIIDEYNGFLCPPGNQIELIKLLNKINNLSTKKIKDIRKNAIITARNYSHLNVASHYIDQIKVNEFN